VGRSSASNNEHLLHFISLSLFLLLRIFEKAILKALAKVDIRL